MKKQISVYHFCYLPLSETFIHRQLLGLERYFNLKVFSHFIQNKEEFPGVDPVVIPRQNLLLRLLAGTNKLQRLIGGNNELIRKQLYGSDLFHVNFGHIAVQMQDNARRAGIPMTAYFLGSDASASIKDPVFCKKLSCSSFEAVFVNSYDMKLRLIPHLPPNMKCHVAYCGIPLEKFPFRQRRVVSDGAVFLQVSRLDPKKGIDDTLKAFSRYLTEVDPRARLLIAGDGPLKSDLIKLSNSLGLDRSVIFLGPIGYKKYIELLHTADVFLHPSVTAIDGEMEGLPTAICEAMACGLPVVATRHSGIPEVIDDEINGFLAEERDVDGIFTRMVQLRKADIVSVSKNARLKIEDKFDHENNIAILSNYMNRIITGDNSEIYGSYAGKKVLITGGLGMIGRNTG
jgi:colanic acid/amylovoran biosynthesis glycosyltransferase